MIKSKALKQYIHIKLCPSTIVTILFFVLFFCWNFRPQLLLLWGKFLNGTLLPLKDRCIFLFSYDPFKHTIKVNYGLILGRKYIQ